MKIGLFAAANAKDSKDLKDPKDLSGGGIKSLRIAAAEKQTLFTLDKFGL